MQKKKSKSDYLSKFYYLIFQKKYLEEKNTYKLALTIQHLRKLIRLFYRNYFKKLITIFKAIDTTLLMSRLTVKFINKSSTKK